MKRSILMILLVLMPSVIFGKGLVRQYGTTKFTDRTGVVKTGQTTVYNAGDDGTYQTGLAFDYTDNGDGTVTDNNTSLMWIQHGNLRGGTTNWAEAINYCEGLNYAGHTDWRLPNAKELHSIVVYEGAAPFINRTYFTNTANSYYWTSTTYVPNTTYVLVVGFANGFVGHTTKSTAYYVRPVRGGN